MPSTSITLVKSFNPVPKALRGGGQLRRRIKGSWIGAPGHLHIVSMLRRVRQGQFSLPTASASAARLLAIIFCPSPRRQAPCGQASIGDKPFTNNAYAVTPTLAAGKGWGRFNIQASFAVPVPLEFEEQIGTHWSR